MSVSMLMNASPVTIARACKMASGLREASWKPDDKHYRGGRYGRCCSECAAEAVRELDLNPLWIGLIYGMISSEFSEPSEWWNGLLAKEPIY